MALVKKPPRLPILPKLTFPGRMKQHPMWHSIYIGLGYLPNDLGLRYRDDVATAKVRELAPDSGYLTPNTSLTRK